MNAKDKSERFIQQIKKNPSGMEFTADTDYSRKNSKLKQSSLSLPFQRLFLHQKYSFVNRVYQQQA